jgi:uncharacterized membrane protein
LHQPPDILLFFGHFHPLLVHLPIGMLAALAALEIAALLPRFKNAAASAGFILALAAPLAVVTAVCGWLLSLAGGYDENLLAWHKWLGTGTAVMTVVAAILFWRGKIIAYRASLLVAVTLLMVAGHLGGSLTHGSDFLTQYAPEPLKKLLGIAPAKKPAPQLSVGELRQLPVFAGVIEPIFQNRCVNCHGAQKSKGDLRLDSFAALLRGGKDDVAIKPGDSAQSPLLERALLPAGDDDHMPPAGKPQLTVPEIALLKWWIDAGAPETNILDQLRPPPEILAVLSAR